MPIQLEPFYNQKSIRLSFGDYQARILPEVGGNLITFEDTKHQYQFIHGPSAEEFDSFIHRPTVHGIPVLFPPNRYEDGTFRINDVIYHLPINEQKTHNHLHGFFYNTPWEVIETGDSESEVFVTIKLVVTPNHPAYTYFPHVFSISIRYELSGDGLAQYVTVTNQGTSSMPCLLGFHTAINAPFAPNSSMDDMELKMTVGERWELNDRMLPTGNLLPLTEEEQKMQTTGISPYFTRLDNHYTALPQDGRNFMALTDRREKVRLTYNVGTKYKHWMIWNKDAKSGYFCPEPQTNCVNAPNLSLSQEKTGLIILDPGESWREMSRIYVEKL